MSERKDRLMANNTQTFNISFPRELVTQIDEVAKRQFGSRSDFLRTAALEYIRREEDRKTQRDETNHTYASDEEALDAANALLQTYKKDFEHLADR